VGRDARARGIHILLGPGVNLYRSPLCGRNFEYLGEDPHLAARSVAAYIRGLQDQGVSATVKHYAVNFQEYDRHRVSSDLDERTLREMYLPAFRAAIEEAGSGAVMTAYNLVNGAHCSEHDFLLRDVLKGEWGFQGLAMSDWVSTYSAVGAANAGLDLEMPTAQHLTREKLLPAVRDGLVPVSALDDKVRRLLRLMICFGWMDHPQQDASIPLEDPHTAAVALEVARRSCVLLRNERGFLPLDPGRVKTLAVIGPCAERTPVCGGGSAWNKPWRTVSILDGLRAQFGAERVRFAPGLMPDDSAAAYAQARFRTPSGAPGLRAEYFNNLDWRGAPVLDRVEPRLEQRWGTGPIAEGVNAVAFSVRWTGVLRPERSGAHVFYQWFMGPFRVRVAGKTLFSILDGEDLKPARVALELEAGREYPVEVLYRRMGDHNGAAVGWLFRDIAAEREAAVRLAREADAVVFCGGHTDVTEGEGFDRPFVVPTEQEDLLLAVAAANPRVAVVITAGGNVDLRRWLDRVPALLYAWYPGQEGGTAVAEILAGLTNPSGRLPATFERALEDRSSFGCYHDADGDKRVALSDGVFAGYRHHDRTRVAPQFAFGFGLSYTAFAYENLRVPAAMRAGETLRVTLDVVNTGSHAGTEVVQLYVSDLEASVPRPAKELKGYAAVALKAGERKTVEFELTERDLQFFCLTRRAWVAEPGEFAVHVAASAADVRLSGTFRYVQPERT
jgi:beta-glucosidase